MASPWAARGAVLEGTCGGGGLTVVFGAGREPLPHDEHDFTVDYIVTPQEVIRCGPPHRPTGVMWNALDHDKIAAIPVLAAMAKEQ